jgi:hypothetical protein
MTTIINGSSPSITFSDATTQNSAGLTSSSTLNAANITTGTLGVANGGTGAATLTANNVLLGNGTSALQAVAPGTNGNLLTSNGTTWTSAAAPAGGVTSVATGNGLSGGTITSTGTLVVACPTFNSVGSYAFCFTTTSGTAMTSGSNYSAGGGTNQLRSCSPRWDSGVSTFNNLDVSTNLSGTWKWMGATTYIYTEPVSLACRVS